MSALLREEGPARRIPWSSPAAAVATIVTCVCVCGRVRFFCASVSSMLFSIVPFISLADPANGGMPGSWEPTYSFTNDPAYGDATYPAGYTDLWGPEMQHMVRQLNH